MARAFKRTMARPCAGCRRPDSRRHRGCIEPHIGCRNPGGRLSGMLENHGRARVQGSMQVRASEALSVSGKEASLLLQHYIHAKKDRERTCA